MNILISAPSYTHGCGGIRVVHYLGYLAKFIGHNVKMDSPYCNPEWGEYSGRIGPPDITVIPEINPITSQFDGNIVRWVLHFPGVLGNGPTVYPPHELVVSYNDVYDYSANVAATRKPVLKFCLPFCEMPTININMNRTIDGVVWYGKADKSQCPTIEGAQEITRWFPSSRLGLVQLLEQTGIAYSFDKYTVFNDEALLCGCKVLLWNGIEFREYTNDKASDVVMDIERDLLMADKFLNDVAEIFGIIR
jgi:hypothetical protein